MSAEQIDWQAALEVLGRQPLLPGVTCGQLAAALEAAAPEGDDSGG